MWHPASDVPAVGRFVWVKETRSGMASASEMLHLTQRATLPNDTAVLFYPVRENAIVSEKPNHAVAAWCYAKAPDFEEMLQRIKLLEKMLISTGWREIR